MADPVPHESREETVERVLDAQPDVPADQGATPHRDVSTRRRLGTRAIAFGVVGAVAGALLGLVIGLVFWNVGIPIALAVLGFALGMLLTGERDDGRVAADTREHVRHTGQGG